MGELLLLLLLDTGPTLSMVWKWKVFDMVAVEIIFLVCFVLFLVVCVERCCDYPVCVCVKLKSKSERNFGCYLKRKKREKLFYYSVPEGRSP